MTDGRLSTPSRGTSTTTSSTQYRQSRKRRVGAAVSLSPQIMDEGPRIDQIRRPPLLAAAKLFKAHAGRSVTPMPVTQRSSARCISFPNARASTTPRARTVLFIGEAHLADNYPTTLAPRIPCSGARLTCPNALPCCTYAMATRRTHGKEAQRKGSQGKRGSRSPV